MNLGEILSTHRKAASVRLLRVVQNTFLTGWTHSPGGASAASIEQVAVGAVDTLARQSAVRSTLACPAFFEGQNKNKSNSNMLFCHTVVLLLFLGIAKVNDRLVKNSG